MGTSLGSAEPVSLRLLGSVDLLSGDGRSVSELLSRPKLIGILAYLGIVAERGYVRRDKLLVLFWPEDDEEHARASLRTALHRIRSSFRVDVIRTRGVDEVGIDSELLQCDVSVFRAHAQLGECRQALDMYSGEFLDAFHIDASPEFHAWTDDQRAGLRMLAADCARRLASGASSARNAREALFWSRRLLAISPNDETALQNLLTALAHAGEAAEAIAAYESFSKHYRDEFDLELSPETCSMIDAIRAGGFERFDESPAEEPATDDNSRSGVDRSSSHAVEGTEKRPRAIPRVFGTALAAVTVSALVLWGIANGYSRVERSPAWIRADLEDAPLPRSHHTLVYDPQSRQVMLFGGASDDAILDDVWRLSLASDGTAKKWQRIRTESPSPVRRWLHFAAYDPGDDTMVIVAGATGHTSPCVADVWVLDNAMRGAPPLKWRKIDIVGLSPAPRAEFGAFYDATNNRLVVHGGHDCIAPVFADLWVLSLAKSLPVQWTELKPATPHGAPPPLRSQVMAYDAESNRAIVFGGMDGRFPQGAVPVGDLWILTNANGLGGEPQWLRPDFRGPPIPPTAKGMGAFDPATNRLIVFGGYHNRGASAVPTADVWVLEGANGRAPHANWRKVIPSGNTPGPRVAGAVTFDPDTERLILFGGYSKGKSLGDIWFLTAATGAR